MSGCVKEWMINLVITGTENGTEYLHGAFDVVEAISSRLLKHFDGRPVNVVRRFSEGLARE